MYLGSAGADIAPPVAAVGAITVLPATGVTNISVIALIVLISLVAWGALYFYKTRNKAQ